MLLRRTVFDKPTTTYAVEAIDAPARKIEVIDPAARLGSKGGGGDPDPGDDDGDDDDDVGGEPADVEAEPEEEPAGDETVAEEVGDLSAVWKQHGFEDLPADPNELRSQLAQLRQQAASAEQYRQHAAVLWQMNQQALAQRQAQQASPQGPKLPWEIPSFDRRLMDQITTDEQGNLVARPGAMPTVVNDYRQWQTAREAALDKFLSDPVNVVQQIAGDFINQRAQQIAQQQVYEYHRRAALEKFGSENSEWLFDAPGVLSPAGNIWNQHYIQALQSGFADPIKYATDAVDAAAFRHDVDAQISAQKAGITPTANAQKKRALLNSATRKPNRTGSFRKAGKSNTPPQNSGRLWSDLRRKLEQLPPDDLEE